MSRFLMRSALALFLAPSPAAAAEELLTVEEAVATALRMNLELQNAALQVESSENDVGAARTRRLPAFDVQMQVSQLVSPVKMMFPAGAFGEIPGVGPFPSADTTIESAVEPAGYLSATISQPITQLHRIGLGVRMSELSRDIDREKLRATRASLIAKVKELYYSMLQTESALEASREQLNLYRELDRVVVQYVAQETALKSEGLDVKTRLAAEEYAALNLENRLATQKEQMNYLLGRDVRTPFSISEPIEPVGLELDLDAARAKALESRPELQQARLQMELAETDRRSKKAELIPDVGVAFTYSSFVNVELLPQNVAMVGVQLEWEPFDWGRKSQELQAKTRAVSQAKNATRDLEDRILLEVASSFRKLQEARTLLAVRKLSRDAAVEKMRVTLNRHRETAVLLKDVLEVQADQAEVNAQYQQALMSLWTARADFERAIGGHE